LKQHSSLLEDLGEEKGSQGTERTTASHSQIPECRPFRRISVLSHLSNTHLSNSATQIALDDEVVGSLTDVWAGHPKSPIQNHQSKIANPKSKINFSYNYEYNEYNEYN
jgi:hypothetical protein